MEIEFDPAKDRRNRKKHGLSLGFAAELDWDAMLMEADGSQHYGEERWFGIAPNEDKLYAVAFTVLEDEIMRIINVRRATNSEVRRYETQGRK
jgi:uncharacterized DUF497 family protein